MKKPIVGVIVLGLMATAIVTGVRWYRGVEPATAEAVVKLYGNIDIRDASLAFNEQERIDKVLVEEGDRVEAGQILAQLKTDRLEAQIREAQAQVGAQREVVNRLRAGSRMQEIEQARAQAARAEKAMTKF
jgi:HlyD family secretion protein